MSAPLPQHDPQFQSAVVLDLIRNFGRYRRVGRLYAGDLPSFDRCRAVGRVVARARRLGFVIEADRRRGYRLTGFIMPARVPLSQPHDDSQPPNVPRRTP